MHELYTTQEVARETINTELLELLHIESTSNAFAPSHFVMRTTENRTVLSMRWLRHWPTTPVAPLYNFISDDSHFKRKRHQRLLLPLPLLLSILATQLILPLSHLSWCWHQFHHPFTKMKRNEMECMPGEKNASTPSSLDSILTYKNAGLYNR